MHTTRHPEVPTLQSGRSKVRIRSERISTWRTCISRSGTPGMYATHL